MNSTRKRIFGLICMGIGLGLVFWLKKIYETGAAFADQLVLITPILILYGGILTVAPDMVIVRGKWPTASAGKRIINVVLITLGVGIGLWLRFSVFKDWKAG